MQTKFFINLIAQNLFTSYNNNKIKHYFIIKKQSKQVKHIKKHTCSLTSIYKKLYKNYNCTNKQLNLIQFVYSTNNNLKYITKYYNLAQRKAIINAYNLI